jgi:ABC-type tungstate transport system substrate-binding protein
MTKTEEIKEAAKELEDKISSLVTVFVVENGECSVNISCYAKIINGVGGKIFVGHDIEVTVTI